MLFHLFFFNIQMFILALLTKLIREMGKCSNEHGCIYLKKIYIIQIPSTHLVCHGQRKTIYMNGVHFIPSYTYRLITAYLLLRVNLDKIMHARWDFDASSARTQRVSALDKHQNWSANALFCLNSRAQSKYAVVNLIHTRRKQTFCLFLCEKLDILVSLKVI